MRKLLPAVALLTFTACGGDEPATPMSAGADMETLASEVRAATVLVMVRR